MSKKKKAVTQDTSAYKKYAAYLQNYDTSNVDNTLGNLTNWASTSSADNLSNMGDYTFNVDGSDWARQRAEDAYYNSMVDKLTPQFERQVADYATMLQNKGLPVGSEAYERAMGDLQEKQNDALQQAAYNAVMGGQEAFSRSLGDEINAGGFGNSAQQAYINQLLSALEGSASGYENQQNLYAVGTAKSAADYQNALAKARAKSGGGLGSTIGALGGAALGAYFGGPMGATVGANIGSSVGGAFGR
ncbi:MAG: hypothetical protein IJS26_03915 [Alphaproteobacteria bacterium]|nr:hypothetical protein [Alphaproteobacteria bacterium]